MHPKKFTNIAKYLQIKIFFSFITIFEWYLKYIFNHVLICFKVLEGTLELHFCFE